MSGPQNAPGTWYNRIFVCYLKSIRVPAKLAGIDQLEGVLQSSENVVIGLAAAFVQCRSLSGFVRSTLLKVYSRAYFMEVFEKNFVKVTG